MVKYKQFSKIHKFCFFFTPNFHKHYVHFTTVLCRLLKTSKLTKEQLLSTTRL